MKMITLCVLLVCSGSVRAEVEHHSLWRVAGSHNVVYLFGSVHLLKAEDGVLPPVAVDAYHDAQLLMMELDPTELNSANQRRAALRMGMLPRGQSLAQVLGPDLYRQFQAQTLPLGLRPEIANHFQPWYATIVMEQFELARAGFDAEAGIDTQFARLARADGKPVIELETLREQLGFFARLSMHDQRAYLRSSLKDAGSLESDAAVLVDAWKHGDTAAMQEATRDQREDSPALFRRLTVERNRRWLPRVIALLNRDQNAMVVVGAMHLVSADGLVEMLRARGYQVEQL